MPADSKVRATTNVLALRETFQIARGAADEETVVALEVERDGIVAWGEGAPVDYWGETPDGDRGRAGGRRRGADRRRSVRRGRARAWVGRPAGREDGAGRGAARLDRPAGRAADLAPARDLEADASDLVHDRDRQRRGDRGPHTPRDRLRGAEDQGRRAGAISSGCGRPWGHRRAAADRRQRGLGPRHGPGADARVARDGRGVRRAAVPGRGSGLLPRLPVAVARGCR